MLKNQISDQGCKFSGNCLNSGFHEVRFPPFFYFQPFVEAFSPDSHTFSGFSLQVSLHPWAIHILRGQHPKINTSSEYELPPVYECFLRSKVESTDKFRFRFRNSATTRNIDLSIAHTHRSLNPNLPNPVWISFLIAQWDIWFLASTSWA